MPDNELKYLGQAGTEQMVANVKSLVESYAQPKGKYLTSVNGVEADENGNVEIDVPEATWESLPDKPFGHFDNKILVSEQYVQHQGVIIAESLPLNGSYINFTIDDVTYSADYNSNNTSYFGNVNLVNMWEEDTGEDYCIWIGEENGVPTYKFYFADTTSDKKVQIEQMEMYLQLDEVWIPPSIARVYDHTWESLPDKPFYNGTREEWLFHITDTSNYSLGDVVNTGDNTEIIVGEIYYPYVNGVTLYGVEAVLDDEYGIPCIPISYADGNCIMKVYHDVNLEFEWRFGVLNHVKFVSGYVPDEVGVYRQEYVLKQLDEEYIPDSIARTDHTHSWNELEDKPFGMTPNIILVEEYQFTPNENNNTFVLNDNCESPLYSGDTITIRHNGNNYRVVGTKVLSSVYFESNELQFTLVYNNDGSLSLNAGSEMYGSEHEIAVYIPGEITCLESYYIGDDIARVSDIPESLPSYTAEDEGKVLRIVNGVPAWTNELILASSTEGSAKQFKITIDDTGTLTVTELTETEEE